jgi:protoporphyrinogen/coproporphyrinogen III oxidase
MHRNTTVVIIGGGLTGLTLAYYLKKSGMVPMVIEKEDRAGGVIRTYREMGFTYESGPNTGVLGNMEVMDLFSDLGGGCELEVANPQAKRRLIWKGGRWHHLPSGLKEAIQTPLFTVGDKLRILGEPFRRRGKDPMESVGSLVKRRMGNSFLDYAVDPFISGIYAGDPDRLVTQYALPKLYRLEQAHGSFIGGAIKKRSPTRDRRHRVRCSR